MRSSRSVSGRCGRRRGRTVLAGVLLGGVVLTASTTVHAQNEANRRPEQLLPEAPPPPRILDEERARQGTARRTPPAGTGDAPAPSMADTALAPELAAPRPDASADLDEVLVVGTALRLPDLGSSLRAQREAERDEGRIDVTFLPLYDPEAARAGFDDPLFRNREMERVGFIDLFNIRFGKRSK